MGQIYRKQDIVGVRGDDAWAERSSGEFRWGGGVFSNVLQEEDEEISSIFTFSASSLTSRVPRLAGLSTRKRFRRFSQSVDM